MNMQKFTMKKETKVIKIHESYVILPLLPLSRWFVIFLLLLTLLHLFLSQSNVCLFCHDMFRGVSNHVLQIVARQRRSSVPTTEQQDHTKNPPGRDAHMKIKQLSVTCSWWEQGRESRLAPWLWLMVILVNAILQTRTCWKLVSKVRV